MTSHIYGRKSIAIL